MSWYIVENATLWHRSLLWGNVYVLVLGTGLDQINQDGGGPMRVTLPEGGGGPMGATLPERDESQTMSLIDSSLIDLSALRSLKMATNYINEWPWVRDRKKKSDESIENVIERGKDDVDETRQEEIKMNEWRRDFSLRIHF
jgi:hypothetical protein